MNKYQAALEVFAEYINLTPHNINELQWADEVLQEIVDKETSLEEIKKETKQAIIDQIDFLYNGEGMEDVEDILEYLRTHDFR